MSLKAKYVLDYETLFLNHEVLALFKDSLLLIPYSNFDFFVDAVKRTLDSNEYDEEQKGLLKELYQPLLNCVSANKWMIEDIVEHNKPQSNCICISTINNIFLAFTNTVQENILSLTEDAFDKLDLFDYDVLCASKKYDAPIFTTSDTLIDFIKKNNLNVEYVVPHVE